MRRLAAAAALVLAGCTAATPLGPPSVPGATGGPADAGPDPPLELATVGTGFEGPVLAIAPAGDDRILVVEQHGLIRVLQPDGTIPPVPFADLRARVSDDGTERGLLSLAFHPQDPARAFVAYTDWADHLVVAEFSVVEGRLDDGSGRRLLRVRQPSQFHNGAMLQFGPEGYLYVSVGDGGGIGDPWGHAQDPTTPHGSILRIWVDGPRPWAAHPANPFLADGHPAVWLHGLRNPWRFWIDPVAGLVHIGDVGQFFREELTIVPLDAPGANLGWPIMEARACYEADTCDTDGLVLPDIAYDHDAHPDRPGCAIQAGPVYRGAAMPALRGTAFYGDFCGGWVRSFRVEGGEVVDDREVVTRVGVLRSFGLDGDGEILVVTGEGEVLRIVESD